MSVSSTWSMFIKQSSAAFFVLSGRTGRLRYANPAWEALTGKQLAQYRGTRLALRRQATSDFWRALAPPPEVLQGRSCQVRRAVPPETSGPPWWIVDFWPIPGDNQLLGILGRITPEGSERPKDTTKVPEWLADLQLHRANAMTLDSFQSTSIFGQRLLNQARLASLHKSPIWLEGEPGTRKCSLARAIHNAGPTSLQPLVIVDLQALKPYLVESLIFSPGGIAHSPQVSAIYFRRAEFLTHELQARLLNWHQRPQAPRYFFGTLLTAEELVQSGAWLPTAFAQFTANRLRLPPLRTLLSDLPQFLATLQPSKQFSESALQLFKSYVWPGNFRELADLLDQLKKTNIEATDLPRHLRELGLRGTIEAKPITMPLDDVLSKLEIQLVQRIQELHPNKPGHVADRLGITRARLAKILSRLPSPPREQP